jgi:hypothetical protein
MSNIVGLEQGLMTTKTNAILLGVAAILGIATSSIAIEASNSLRGDKWYHNRDFGWFTNAVSIFVLVSAGVSLTAQVLETDIPFTRSRAVF